MPAPSTCGELAALLAAARRDFFREVGDSANAVVLDAAAYREMVSPELKSDERGRQYLFGLEVLFSDLGRGVRLAKLVDPLDACESCRGL